MRYAAIEIRIVGRRGKLRGGKGSSDETSYNTAIIYKIDNHITLIEPENKIYESAAQMPTTTILLRNIKKFVTPVRTARRATFLDRRKKASLAEEQKLVPCTAHMMYALRFRNLMNFSRHQKQHLHTHRTPFTTILSWWYLASFPSIFSKMTRIIRNIAMMSDPKATVPR